jgi:hypothetical protein
VLLDYDSGDGLREWVLSTFCKEISERRLIYAYFGPAPHFKMAHAKNLSHRISTGDILCNLDADNFIVRDFSTWLRARFSEDPDIIISAKNMRPTGYIETRVLRRILGHPRPTAGLSGRIALTRNNFTKIGGYDERYSAWGSDDVDFQLRAIKAGIRPLRLPQDQWGGVIGHGGEERLRHLSEADRLVSKKRLALGFFREGISDVRRRYQKRATVPNEHGLYGLGRVEINFGEQVIEIGPARTADDSPPLFPLELSGHADA